MNEHQKTVDGAYCRAAKIIPAFRSRRLASRFSGLSSQTALPPISWPGGNDKGGSDDEGVGALIWSERLYREMSVSFGVVGFAVVGPAAVPGGTAGAVRGNMV